MINIGKKNKWALVQCLREAFEKEIGKISLNEMMQHTFSREMPQYKMTLTIEAEHVHRVILEKKPSDAKKAGKQIDIRKDWQEVKEGIMLEIVRQKFLQHKDLSDKLIATYDEELIESNLWHDNVWGDCLCHNCKNIVGKNLLGKILMQVREELRKVQL